MGLIAGRPTLDVILAHQNASQRARYIASAIQRQSPLLQLLEFEASVTANPRQKTLEYPYSRKNTVRVAQKRNWNQDYTAQYTEGETNHSALLKAMGDAFEIDRVFANVDPQYVQDQIDAMAPGIAALFADLAINGDNAADGREFDGLSKILTGTTQELDGSGINLSGSATDKDLRKYINSMRREIRKMRRLGYNPIVLSNEDLIFQLEQGGEQLGYIKNQPDQFGVNEIVSINGASLVDVGLTNIKDGSNNVTTKEIIPTETVGGNLVTDVYIVGISATNGFAGLTLDGANGTSPLTYQTLESSPGVMRRFEAELVGGVALYDMRAAVVFRNVRIG